MRVLRPVLVALVVLVSVGCARAGPDRAVFEQRAQSIVTQLGEGRFDEVAAAFSPCCSTLPPAAAVTFWNQTLDVLGDFHGILPPVTSTDVGEGVTVDVPASFGDASMKVRVSFTDEGELTGYWLVDPGQPLPRSDHLLVGGMLIVAGLVVMLIGWLGRNGQLPRKSLSGIRLPTTMRSDSAWQATHVAAGPWLIAAGVPVMVAGIVVLVLRRADELPAILAVGAMTPLLLVGTVRGLAAARKVAD